VRQLTYSNHHWQTEEMLVVLLKVLRGGYIFQHHHHISVMELGHLLSRSGITSFRETCRWLKIFHEYVMGPEQVMSGGRFATFSLWTGIFHTHKNKNFAFTHPVGLT